MEKMRVPVSSCACLVLGLSCPPNTQSYTVESVVTRVMLTANLSIFQHQMQFHFNVLFMLLNLWFSLSLSVCLSPAHPLHVRLGDQ